MAPSPKNPDAPSTAAAFAAGPDRHEKRPQSPRVLCVAKRRDPWKTPCLAAKTAVKRRKNTGLFFARSQEPWKSRVKALASALAPRQARARASEGASVLFKKRVRHTTQREPSVWPLSSLRSPHTPLRWAT